ncbi:mevalonate kinase [Marinobacterium sp. D7]|uniref:mevalonate kinase family protein n=1 Tax=Marinobacterium ramblicola TaxID=2849041 RepID=UPI001C2DD124|nr:mevalonate kinase [Marinobacterium ramblicola]MBV1787222.1 mevalonate kinase [Marinobacterium ramblicola]
MRVACAPGKVILSGEHAVVYGAPALALAVDRHMRVYFEPDRLPRLSWHAQERTHVLGLDKFAALRRRLDSHFESYLRGELSITQILKKPAELAFYAVDMARMISGLESIPRGSVRIDSDIPIGAGMGSSAALIAALLKLFGHIDDLDQLIKQVHHCERLQHGRGSLIDAATVCSGGLVRLRDGQISRLQLGERGLGNGWYWVFTGTPAASTGACVERVRRGFATSSIWSEFADLTAEIELALCAGGSVTAQVRENHRLLTRIGVVPAPLLRFAEQVEQQGGAAKVSGAGSVSGDNGGLMLVWLPEGSPGELEMPGDWHWGQLKEDPDGVRLLDDQG